MRTMTITEGLVELKTLDSRIAKAINKQWVGTVKVSDKDSAEVEEVRKSIEANLQSVVALINERNAIKSAIVKSNAVTMVRVGEQEMTVAEAIERKSSIEYEQALKETLLNQINRAQIAVRNEMDSVQAKLDRLLEQLMGSGKANLADEQKAITEAYLQKYAVEVLDPIGAGKLAQELDRQIADFKANVDVALSVSNAVTMIEV